MNDLIDKAKTTLEDLVVLLPTTIKELCTNIIRDDRFQKAPGSSGIHHAYSGGLLVHTAEVAEIATGIIDSVTNIGVLDWVGLWEVTLVASIFHDYRKVDEYIILPSNQIIKTEYRNKIRHVAGSYHEFMNRVQGKDLDKNFIHEVGHAILAHHGRFEWGSPVEPQTLPAYALHYADMLSVNFGEGRKRKSV